MVDSTMDTATKIASMLTENTGRHMLDSGGAYGRHWERNQGKGVETFMAEPEASVDKWGGVTLSLFHWLMARVEYVPDLDAEWDEFQSKPEYEHEGWLTIMEDFAADRQSRFGTGYPFERPTTENSYNQCDLLTQTIQFTIWSEEEGDSYRGGDTFVLLQVHGGADVRGGYSKPVVFQIQGGGDYAFEFFEYERYEVYIVDRTPPVNRDQLRLDGTKIPDEELDPLSFTRFVYDTMHGWEIETYGGSTTSMEEVFGEHADLFMEEETWDEERGTFKSPDGNGWLAFNPPYVSS